LLLLQNYLNESLKCLEKPTAGGGTTNGGGGGGGNVSPDHHHAHHHLLLHHQLDSKVGLESKLLINSHLTSLEKK
jgi:hypothetical protein